MTATCSGQFSGMGLTSTCRPRVMGAVIATFSTADQLDRFARELYRLLRVEIARATLEAAPDPDPGREVAVAWASAEEAASVRSLAARMGGVVHEP